MSFIIQIKLFNNVLRIIILLIMFYIIVFGIIPKQISHCTAKGWEFDLELPFAIFSFLREANKK